MTAHAHLICCWKSPFSLYRHTHWQYRRVRYDSVGDSANHVIEDNAGCLMQSWKNVFSGKKDEPGGVCLLNV